MTEPTSLLAGFVEDTLALPVEEVARWARVDVRSVRRWRADKEAGKELSGPRKQETVEGIRSYYAREESDDYRRGYRDALREVREALASLERGGVNLGLPEVETDY